MPAEQGDAERFAAAEERGVDPRSVGDPGLARDLQIAALLRGAGASDALAPREDERARMRARMKAELAGAAGPAGAQPAGPDPVAEPDTAPIEQVPLRLAPGDAGHGGRHDLERLTGGRPDTAVLDAAELPGDAEEGPGPVEGGASVTSLAGRRGRRGRHTLPGTAGGRSSARRSSLPGRVVLVAAAAAAAVLAVAGGGVLASRNALPGDTLYPVKRVAESIGDVLTVGDTARAQRRFDNATTRLDEVSTLVSQQPDAANPQLVESGFQDFDSATGAGARAMLAGHDAGGTATQTQLHGWAVDQARRLSALRQELPASARPDADSAIALLERLAARTAALAARASCPQVTSGVSDDLGLLPATGACPARSGERAIPDGRTSTDPSRQAGTEPQTGTDDTSPADQPGQTGGSGSDGGILPAIPGVTGGNGSSGSSGSSESSGSGSSGSSSGTPTSSAKLPLPLPTIQVPLPGGGIKIG